MTRFSDRYPPPRKKQENKKKKERTCYLVEFAVEIKENEKRDKYFDLARELKKVWYMKVTVILIVNCALGTVLKGLVRELEELEIGGRIETIKTKALGSARILRRVLES